MTATLKMQGVPHIVTAIRAALLRIFLLSKTKQMMQTLCREHVVIRFPE